MSRPPTAPSSRSQAPQSSAPQPRSIAPQSSASAATPRSQAPQSMSSSMFDPRQAQASQAAPSKQPVYRKIDANTKKIVPSSGVVMQAVSISLETDKPMILTFWWDSILRNVFLNCDPKERETIIKKHKENPADEEEFTSRIMKDHGNGIFETENSIYIVVPDIQKR